MQTKQAQFHIRFIWWALGLAIFAGFALGAHVASVIGLDLPLGKGFYAFVQIHGFLQLIGWAGLFIIGISLHFIPRLAGVPLARPQNMDRILALIATGLVLRFVSHSLLPYLVKSPWFAHLSICVVLSGLLVWLGIMLYLVTVIQTVRSIPRPDRRPALQSVQPFFFMMFLGWFFYATLNALLLYQMVSHKELVIPQPWDEFTVKLFIDFVLLPVAFAFSVRLFPLYLRLPALDWPVRTVAVLYFLSVILQLLPALPPIMRWHTHVPVYLFSVGAISKGGVILWFIWKLDLLTRRRDPWTVHRILHPGPERRPTRPGLPDYGEFGRFELLVYAAYVWLILGALLESVGAIAFLFGWSIPVSTDAIRHIYLLGFITQLIFGMAPRMLPGFLKKKRIAIPELVTATFWLGTVATVSRVLPLILPPILYNLPLLTFLMQTAFAFSGVIGISAVVCLAINLIKTSKSVA